jgi:hypothetical protein
MNVKNDISEELRLLSELVATISRETPYRVTEDYFTDLSSRVLVRIKTQHKPVAFNVPEGYFDQFAEGLLARIKSGAAIRLGEGSGLADTMGGGWHGAAGLGLPGGEVEQELAALSPLLVQLRKRETYRMPEGYFEEVSPVLAVAKDLNPYTVPEEYFHRLPVEIAENVSDNPMHSDIGTGAAKVVAIGGRRTRLWQYSAAAVVAGLILTIGWLRLNVAGGSHGGTSLDIPAKIAKVSDQDLQRFLADQPSLSPQPIANLSVPGFDDSDMRSLLGDVPDGELKQYIEEHGGGNDIATN